MAVDVVPVGDGTAHYVGTTVTPVGDGTAHYSNVNVVSNGDGTAHYVGGAAPPNPEPETPIGRRRKPLPVTHTRKVLSPSLGTIFHLIGDTHLGSIDQWRVNSLISDRGDRPRPAATIQLGDQTDHSYGYENDLFEQQVLDRLTGPVHLAQGNHDLYNQSPAEWAKRWGYKAQNYAVNVDDVRLVVLGGDVGQPVTSAAFISAASLTWLDQQLTAAGNRPVFIACHFPLWDTVGASFDQDLEFTSRQDGFFAKTVAKPGSSQSIIDVLAGHSNVKAWLSGHTHSNISVPGLVMPIIAGGRRIAHVNASCLWYCGKHPTDDRGATDPVHSSYAVWTGDKLEVRYRHHVAGRWYGTRGSRVFTVTGLG